MGLIEVDPRQRAYAALAVAIAWYKEIDSEAAMRIVDDAVTVKREGILTPEIIAEAKDIIINKNTAKFNSFVMKNRINKYTVLKEIGLELFDENNFIPDEGVISALNIAEILRKMNKGLKDLQKNSEQCNGNNCDKCPLDMDIGDSMTLCEWLMEMEFNEKGVPLKRASLAVPLIRYDEILQGETTTRHYRIFNNVMDKIKPYLENHKKDKMHNIVNKALLDYIEKRKRIEENMCADK